MADELDFHAMLAVAIEEASAGLAEGGIPIGAALFDGTGRLLGRGQTGAYSMATPPCTAKPMHSAVLAGSAATGTRLWSPR